MGSRSGDVDPGLLLYLLRTQNMTVDVLDDILNHQSGLKGISGQSGDVRELEKAAASGDAYAEMALGIFAYRVRKYIGAYAAAMGGLDAVAFTGGVGEHSSQMRARITQEMEFLGARLSDEHNQAATGHEPARISIADSHPQIWVIPTDEERQIAREIQTLLSAA